MSSSLLKQHYTVHHEGDEEPTQEEVETVMIENGNKEELMESEEIITDEIIDQEEGDEENEDANDIETFHFEEEDWSLLHDQNSQGIKTE